MKNPYIQLIAFAFVLLTGIAHAQTKQTQPCRAAIQLTARAYADSVVLRWAPDGAEAWAITNQYGYAIERTEVPANGAFDPASYQRLNPSAIKPWPLDKWAGIAGKNSDNSMAAIAAQALYGKSFTANSNNFLAKADEFANRWSFAILAADLNASTATAMGLRFTDKNVVKGNVYIYRVFCLADSLVCSIEPGYFVVNTADLEQIPLPTINKATELQNAIQLDWDREYHEKAFSAYWIERSNDNGKTFKKLSQVPFLNPQNDMREKSNIIVYTDSLKDNYVLYNYRIIGITSFGELSKASQAVTAMGRDRTSPAPPVKVKAVSLGGSRMKLTWEKAATEKDMKGFMIGRSKKASEGFQPLFEKPLPPSARSWIDENADPASSNYYIVAAIDTAGNGGLSTISFGMISDSIPPKPPVGLKGSIDTLGIVRISWNMGKEPDLAGYMIYFSNDPKHVFSSTTVKPLHDTVFVDTISIKNLSHKIYYKIKSVDVTYNYSAFSEMLELKKPDRIPPTSPVFSDYKVTDNGIRIEWIPSYSEDVTKHKLYRKIDKGAWVEYRTFSKESKITSFDDINLIPGTDYSYRFISMDESGNASKPSTEMTLKFTGSMMMQAVTNIYATVTPDKKGILLSWNYPVQGKYRFAVYRAVNGGIFQTVKMNEQKNTSYTDRDIKKGVVYEYQVRVFFTDGKKSALGKVIKINL